MGEPNNPSERDHKRRTVLQSLQVNRVVPGPLAGGLDESDWILVGSFINLSTCRMFQRELSAAGMNSWTKIDGYRTNVYVDYGHRQNAFELFALFRQRYPDRKLLSILRPHDFVILGGTTGALLGVGALFLDFPTRIIVWLGCIANGAFLGYLADRYRRLRRPLMPGQYTIVDILLLTVAAALLLASYNFLARLTAVF